MRKNYNKNVFDKHLFLNLQQKLKTTKLILFKLDLCKY